MVQLTLREFDISSIPEDKVVVFIGMRGTGKSILVRDYLFYHQDIPIGMVISPTECANKFFSKFIPNVFIHDDIRTTIIDNVLKRQKIIIKKINKEKKKGKQSKIDPRAFLILDDCMYNKSWINNETIRCLFMNGRHYKINFLITMQTPMGLPPNLRSNIDYVFILRENKTNNRKRIYENYAGMFPTFETFCTVMDQCTENYECLVVHNTANSNKLEDQVFWYKADYSKDNYRIGAPEFWDLQNDDDDTSDEDEEMFDIQNFNKKKNQPHVSVKKKYNR